ESCTSERIIWAARESILVAADRRTGLRTPHRVHCQKSASVPSGSDVRSARILLARWRDILRSIRRDRFLQTAVRNPLPWPAGSKQDRRLSSEAPHGCVRSEQR